MVLNYKPCSNDINKLRAKGDNSTVESRSSQVMNPHDNEKTFEMFGIVVLYHVSFFIFITTIGLNIIFGIIVDTFSELRDLKVR